MEIKKNVRDDTVELQIEGRLDAYWADHLSNELTAVIREGSHHLVLDLTEVSYISSAGIRVFLNFHRQLTEIHGSISVSRLSSQARSVLEMAGLSDFLLRPVGKPEISQAPEVERIEQNFGTLEVFSLQKGASLDCVAVGNPQLLEGLNFHAEHAQKVSFPASSFGLGLGAFGSDFAECRTRFGEFLAVAGAAAYLPTDSTNVPDYLISSGKYVPEMMVLYALICKGKFSSVVRFETGKETGPVGIGHFIEPLMKLVDCKTFGMVLVAETSGLVGAALIKSPAMAAQEDGPFRYPNASEWLTFTAERAFPRSLTLVTGIVDRNPDPGMAPFLRPIKREGNLAAHLHAAAFPYHPLKKGVLDLDKTVATLFESESILGVLHLLHDDRAIGGAGQSELVRGACWISPIHSVERKL